MMVYFNRRNLFRKQLTAENLHLQNVSLNVAVYYKNYQFNRQLTWHLVSIHTFRLNLFMLISMSQNRVKLFNIKIIALVLMNWICISEYLTPTQNLITTI